jgi:site-specific recombinase
LAKLQSAAEEKAQLAKKYAQEVNDPQIRNDILDEVSVLQSLIDQTKSAINDLTNKPSNPTAQRRVADAAERLKDWSENITELLTDPSVVQQVLQKAARDGDKVLI